VYTPVAFQYATQFSVTLSEYCSPVSGRIIVTRVNFSKSPATRRRHVRHPSVAPSHFT
jgi:hypothetical protein